MEPATSICSKHCFCCYSTIYASLITVFCVVCFISWFVFIPLVFGTAIMIVDQLVYITTLFWDMSSWFFACDIALCQYALIISYMSLSYMPLWIKLIRHFRYCLFESNVRGSIDLTAVPLSPHGCYSAIAYLMTKTF